MQCFEASLPPWPTAVGSAPAGPLTSLDRQRHHRRSQRQNPGQEMEHGQQRSNFWADSTSTEKDQTKTVR